MTIFQNTYNFFFPESIGTKLIRIVIGFYLVIALLVTLVLIAEEIMGAKRDIFNTLTIYEKSISTSLAGAVWNMDAEDLHSIVNGMLEIPEIWGVKVTDPGVNRELIAIGWVLDNDNSPNYRGVKRPTHQDKGNAYFFTLFFLEFPIQYKHETGMEVMGTITVYSATQAIFDRVWRRMTLIIAGALIKTLSIWFIFLHFNKRILTAPLASFMKAVEGVNLERMDRTRIHLKMDGHNELTDLRDSFNAMLNRLHRESEKKRLFAENLEAANNELELLKNELEERVKKRTRQLEESNNELNILSSTDMLTQLYNRRHLDLTLKHEIQRCERYGTLLSVILLDIDHFKAINDTFGHEVGDEVLKNLARTLQNNTRDLDTVSRWGGEEFLLITPGIGIESSLILAEKLRKAIETQTNNTASIVTASFGVTEYTPGDTKAAIVRRADMALYQAKAQGRNRVVQG